MAITQAQRDKVLERLEAGDSLRNACDAADIQHESYVRKLADADAAFEAQYRRARETGYRALGDALLSVADDLTLSPEDRKIMIDARKWTLSKMLPKVYGDRVALEHSGSVASQALSTDELMRIAASGKPAEPAQ